MPTIRKNPTDAFRTPLNVIVTIIGISAIASAFLFWLVYYHEPSDAAQAHLLFLPALNAGLNLLCTIALLIGFRHIWHGRVLKHRNAMFTAFLFSTLFLVSYITNHAMHGDAKFPMGHPTARFIYLWILLTPHILASMVALPLILLTLWYATRRQFKFHKKIARWTFPIWLYVSVTGVIVYFFLKAYVA